MTLAPQITFRNMQPMPKLEAAVLKEASRLERFFPRIVSCRVAIEGPRREEFGGLYRVRIDLGVPGEELLVDETPTLHGTLRARGAMRRTKEDEPHREQRYPELAIREAFNEMRRRLQDYVGRIGGETKHHEALADGKVVQLEPEENYGFIESDDGREVYFHRNSVLDGHFKRLRIGSRVRFDEEMGEKGPQATTVALIQPARQARRAGASVLVPARRAARG